MVALIEAMLDSDEYQAARASRNPSANIPKGSAEDKLIATLKADIKGLVGQPVDPDKLELGKITEEMVELAVVSNKLRDKIRDLRKQK